MPASRNYLIEGIDPSQSTCLSAQDLINLIRAAAPASDIGFVYKGTDGPDVNLYPEMDRFLYLSADGMLRFYKNGGWELVKAALALVPGSIALNFLSPIDPWSNQPATSKIIRVNNAGTSFEFYHINDIIENLNITRLSTSTTDSVLSSNNNTNTWLSIRDLWTKISNALQSQDIVNLWQKIKSNLQDKDIPVSKLTAGDKMDILVTDHTGAVVWKEVNNIIGQQEIEWTKLKYDTIVVSPSGDPPVYILDCTSSISFKVNVYADATIRIENMLDGQSIQVFVVPNGNAIGFEVQESEGLAIKWPGNTMPDISTTTAFVATFSRFDTYVCGTIVRDF